MNTTMNFSGSGKPKRVLCLCCEEERLAILRYHTQPVCMVTLISGAILCFTMVQQYIVWVVNIKHGRQVTLEIQHLSPYLSELGASPWKLTVLSNNNAPF